MAYWRTMMVEVNQKREEIKIPLENNHLNWTFSIMNSIRECARWGSFKYTCKTQFNQSIIFFYMVEPLMLVCEDDEPYSPSLVDLCSLIVWFLYTLSPLLQVYRSIQNVDMWTWKKNWGPIYYFRMGAQFIFLNISELLHIAKRGIWIRYVSMFYIIQKSVERVALFNMVKLM